MGSDGTFTRAFAGVVPGAVPPDAIGQRGEIERPHHTGGINLEKRFENLPPGPYTIVARSFDDPARCAVTALELPAGADQSAIVKLPADRGP